MRFMGYCILAADLPMFQWKGANRANNLTAAKKEELINNEPNEAESRNNLLKPKSIPSAEVLQTGSPKAIPQDPTGPAECAQRPAKIDVAMLLTENTCQRCQRCR
jgi:hypothetical protein